MAATSAIAAEAVAAARQGADDQVLRAMLDSAKQQDDALRWVLRTLGILLAASMVANVVLVAFVLQQSFSVQGNSDGVGVTVGAQP